MQILTINPLMAMKILLITLAFSILPFQVSASGSYSPKASGFNNSSKNQNYNYGKNVIQKKLLCGACPLSNIDINSTQAKQILRSLNISNSDISNSLSRREQKSVAIYLKRRFGL